MKPYYECHITMDHSAGDVIAIAEKVKAVGWTFSCINGDPDLGPGVKCYATKQFNCLRYDIHDVIDWLELAAEALSEQRCNIIRKKVEKVLYDVRVTEGTS